MSQAAEVTDSQWDAAVIKSDVPVLVDFWAEWCAPCRAMGPYVDKLAGEYTDKLKVVKLNTQDNPEVPAKYGITAIPTFLLIKGGEVVDRITGSVNYDGLKKAVDPHLG
jgi:thioredoxin 1